jgi:GTP-binding protein LepA
VDFSYEVSRSLAACEGAILVVDAAQGVQAQTVANVYLALDNDLTLLPVLNKIDLPAADPERVRKEIEEIIGLDCSEAVAASAKQGIGTEEILEQIVRVVPPPRTDPSAPLRALIFDSWFDPYHGAVCVVRVFDGVLRRGDRIRMMHTGREFEVTRVGTFSPRPVEATDSPAARSASSWRRSRTCATTNVGDTITSTARPAATPLPGFKAVKPMVFSGLYPTDSSQYEPLRDAVEKLRLNDSAFTYEPESSLALGFGFRCGFLGLLHMEIIGERLEREFDLSLITTAPTVQYIVRTTDGETHVIESPAKLPPVGNIETIEEPFIVASIHLPESSLGRGDGAVRGEARPPARAEVPRPRPVACWTYDLPLNEVVLDFYDRLKSVSRGYASLDYEFLEHRADDLVKLDIRINGDPVDALSLIVHRDKAYPAAASWRRR